MARVNRQLTRERERIAWAIRQQGQTEREIAVHLRMSPSGVHRLLVRIERRILAELRERALTMKVEQTAELRKRLQEALTNWKQSRRKKSPDDVLFLAVARYVLGELRKVWALNGISVEDRAARVLAILGESVAFDGETHEV